MKKTLSVYDNKYNWHKFEFETAKDLIEPLKQFQIKITETTSIGPRTSIGYGTSIGPRTSIGDGTSIGPRTSIGDGTSIGPRTSIGYGTSIGDDEKIVLSIYLTASKHPVNWWGTSIIQIGCKSHTIKEWEKNFKEVGHAEGYTPEQIKEYSGYIKLCKTLQASLPKKKS